MKRLEFRDIPFEETRAVEPAAPPIWNVFQSEDARRYWVGHVLDGMGNLAFHYGAKLLPVDWVSRLGGRFGRFAQGHYAHRLFAKRVETNLGMLAARGRLDVEKTRAKWWENTGRASAEFSVVNRLWRDGRIRVEGRDHLSGLDGPPIFVSVHLGAWEAVFVAVHGALAGPSTGPFQPEPNRFTNGIVYRLRKARGQYLFPPGPRSARRLYRLLVGGAARSLTIFVDEVRAAQVHFPLLGRGVPDRGNVVVAVKLANAAKGVLVPVYLRREGDARFVLVIEPPLERGAGYEVEAAILGLNQALEPAVLARPEEWYMAQELRWE